MTSPNHEPSLAEALERALGHRDSATGLVDDELADLVRLAETLEASASDVVASPDFRAAARQRLLVQMARSARANRHVQPIHRPAMDRVRLWAARFAAVVTATGVSLAAPPRAPATARPPRRP